MLTVYRASAGSGKTYTLVRHYLEMAFDATDERSLRHRFAHVLAITFTNKAAAEMKSRIMRELNKIINGTSDHKDFDPAKAAIVKQSILHNYSDFAVTTIDSFMQRVVRTFAHDLQLPLNFDVALDHDEIIQAGVNELLALIGRDGEENITQILSSMAYDKMDNGMSYNLDNDLSGLGRTLFDEDSGDYLSQIASFSADDFKRISQQLKEDNRLFEKHTIQLAAQAVSLCEQRGLVNDHFPGKSRGLLQQMRAVAEGDISKVGKRNKDWDKAVSNGNIAHKEPPASAAAAIEALQPQLSDIYEKLMEMGSSELPAYNTRKIIIRNLYTMAAMGRLLETMNHYCADNDILHISEFNKRINQEVSGSPSPFIYERLGSRYQNYLIDEFQDTSWLQWHNLAPLLHESSSQQVLGPSASNLESLIVGDGKQSIYRFRQGDVSQFIDLPYLRQDGGLIALGTQESLHTLWTNYRSNEQIVRFNNTFFHWALHGPLANNQKLHDIYIGNVFVQQEQWKQASTAAARKRLMKWNEGSKELLHQDYIDQNRGGLVRLEFHNSKANPKAQDSMLNRIYAIVEHLVCECGYRQGDIQILAHLNKHLSDIAEALQGRTVGSDSLRIESDESYKLKSSLTVRMIASMLRWVADPGDRVLEARSHELLRQCGLPLPDLTDLALNGQRLQAALMALGIDINVEALQMLSLYDRCEAVVRALNADLMEPHQVAALLDVVHNYTLRHGQEAAGFSDWLDAKLPSLSCPANGQGDAIRLLSIHKAKGLEAPVVILYLPARQNHNKDIWVNVDNSKFHLPVCRVTCKKDDNTLFSEQIQRELSDIEMDETNALYVALTRPRERLYVVAETNVKSDFATPLLWQFAQKANTFGSSGDSGMELADAQLEELDDSTTFCQWGDDSQPPRARTQSDDTQGHDTALVPRLAMPGWHDRIRIALQNYRPDDTQESTATRHGLQMHEVLSNIRTDDDIDEAVAVYARRHSMPQSALTSLAAQLRAIVAHPVCAPYFAPGLAVRNECSLIYHGKLRRPDRIVERDGTTWVVDFKTGHAGEEARQRHRSQVAEYCEALRCMGRDTVLGVILYLGDANTQPTAEQVL